MAAGKRKREDVISKHMPVKKAALDAHSAEKSASKGNQTSSLVAVDDANGESTTGPIHVQVITGSYERVLHGISATIPRSKLESSASPSGSKVPSAEEDVVFQDTFLFAAHTSAIRCLAISPPGEDAEKCYLATGSSDERINVYSLSTAPPPSNAKPNLPSLTGVTTAENPRNRSLGSLIHHDRAITQLHFPTRSKLFSAAEDATICISRTRDWTVLSSIKAPIPKPQGRPSGDTAGPGEIPAGVNDFAIHPSQKVMLSVGRGEKCMRLWNLMTGKKAGVLNFDRELLGQVGESKFSSGEGRKVLWDEENMVVGFERGAAIYGLDSKPKAVIKPSPPTKLHQMRFLPSEHGEDSMLAISTEDGRMLFYDIGATSEAGEAGKLPQLPCIAQLGGRAAGIEGRIKDFDIVKLPTAGSPLLIVTGSSDGAVRLWNVPKEQLGSGTSKEPNQVGEIIASKETGNRITCLGAFPLDGKASDSVSDAADEMAGAELDDGVTEDSDDNSD